MTNDSVWTRVDKFVVLLNTGLEPEESSQEAKDHHPYPNTIETAPNAAVVDMRRFSPLQMSSDEISLDRDHEGIADANIVAISVTAKTNCMS